MRIGLTNPRFLLTVAAIVLGAALIVRLITHSGNDQYEVAQIPFDPVPWQKTDWAHASAATQYRTIRSNMIEDLLSRYRFNGWSRQQIIDLLGQSDTKGEAFDEWDMVYVLGLARNGSLSLDYEALCFKFDAHDHVVEYRLSVD